MKKRLSLLSFRTLLVFLLVSLLSWTGAGKPGRAFYQLTVYHFSTEEQEKTIDNYLQNALLPALHRMDITSVGVFKALANDTVASKLLIVFIPLKSLETVTKLREKLEAD